MDYNLRGKVAAIAGASSGLGFATAMALSQEGCRVGICARRTEQLDKAARTIKRESGGEVSAIPLDLDHPDNSRIFVRHVFQAFGQIDILVANTSGPPSTLFLETNDDQWIVAIDGIVRSVISMFHEALPLVAQSDQGRLIVISSISAKQPQPALVMSNATRAALHGIVKTLSREVAHLGVTVNAVCPGTIQTERQVQLAHQAAQRENLTLDEALRRRVAGVPLARMGDPTEFAAAVTFLASRQAAYITGIALPVDGGAFAGLP